MPSSDQLTHIHSIEMDLEAIYIDDTIKFLHDSIQSSMFNMNQYEKELEWHRQHDAICEEDIKMRHVNDICYLRKEILTSIQIVIKLLDEIEKIVIDNRLYNWKINQMYAGYGDRDHDEIHISSKCTKSADIVLDEIQIWFGQLNDIIKETQQLIDFMCLHSPFIFYDEFKESKNDIKIIHKILIKSSLIIEEHPPQVIKKDTR